MTLLPELAKRSKRRRMGFDFLSPQKQQAEEKPQFNYAIETQGGEIVTRDPFNPDFIRPLFEMFHVQIDKMANKAQSVKVTTDEELETATLLTNQAKQLEKAIEKKRIEEKEPYLKVTSVLDSETKGLKDRIAKIKGYLDSLITPYLRKKEEARREAERRAAEEAAKLQAELDEKARLEKEAVAAEARKKAEAEGLSKKQAEEAAKQAAALVEDAPVVVAEAPQEVKVQTEAGSAKIKEEYIGELVDIRLIPDECIQSRWKELVKAVQPYINAQIASGKRSVPGFEIKKVVKLETRAAKRGTSSGKW